MSKYEKWEWHARAGTLYCNHVPIANFYSASTAYHVALALDHLEDLKDAIVCNHPSAAKGEGEE